MTLSGRAAAERPDLNNLAPIKYGIVTHAVRTSGTGGRAWVTAGPGRPDLGGMTEAERRQAGLRRNGQPRRKAATA